MKQFELGQDAPEGLAHAADQVFVELQLVTRRLRRVERLIGAVCMEETGPPWSLMQGQCLAALEAVSLAAASVPDAAPEHERQDRALVVRDLRVDRSGHRAWFGEQELELATKEFSLLGALALEPMRVHSKAELLRNVWGYRSAPRTRTVDSHASRLRRKLMEAGATPQEWVVNEWGVGYALLRPGVGPAGGGRQ
ncbi:winged helix-turn-helix domain-containing protein [Miltoncostaea oceani]|uniref:winged helix-turn-helix domain-containing protein n=1 Tax=Miltoncostaea oceani TaxID=2843216 RepID=UPI001C3E2545|nr:winged helix-turn-helix domain-containing protein [Miltoncostaea oceani]